MPRFTPKRRDQILTQMVASTVARSDLSDIGDAAVTKHILAAVAQAISEVYFQQSLQRLYFSLDKAKGADLDERAKDFPFTITRRGGQRATGYVVFYTNVAVTSTKTISAGTRVKTTDGALFTTTAATTITATSPEVISGHGLGRDSGLTPVTAEDVGSSSNVLANTVIKFQSKPAGVDGVTNPSATVNGLDSETDDEFRNRIKAYVASLARSTVVALETSVLGAQLEDSGQTILFAKAVEDIINRGYVELFIDDGTGSVETIESVTNENVTEGLAGPPAPHPSAPNTSVGGELVLNLDHWPIKTAAGITIQRTPYLGVPVALVSGVDYTLNPANGQLVFTSGLTAGDTITATYVYFTGLIALAQKIIDGDPNNRETYPGWRAGGVLVQVKTPQVLLQNVSVTTIISEGYNDVTVRTNVEQAIKDYINSLGVSDDVVMHELIRRIMSVDGIVDISMTDPTTNVVILDNQLIRTTDSNISVT